MRKGKSLFAIAAILFMMGVTSCGSMKKVHSPFTESRYKTDNTAYRARDMATSMQEDVALDKATFYAREELASQIKTRVQKFNDRFIQDLEKDLDESLEKQFGNLTEQVVDVVLLDSFVSDEEVLRNRKTGQYKYWVVVSMPQAGFENSYLDRLNKAISTDDELKINIDMQEYEKKFDQEFN